MIATSHSPGLVSVTVFGEFTLADYKEFEDLVNYKVRFEGPVSLMFNLKEMANFTMDVAWEEIRFSREHAHDFNCIAVVTDSQWLAWSAWISAIFVDSDVQVFPDEETARTWLSENLETAG